MNYLQDAAALDAVRRGFSIRDLEAQGKAWVLSRFRMELRHCPEWGKQFEVCTWAAGIERVFAMRDYRVLDSEGGLVAEAWSAWLMIQLESRRPVRLPAVFRNAVTKGISGQNRASLHALNLSDPLESVGEISVRSSDTDFNRHVNHVAYVDWLLNSLPFSFRDGARLCEIQLEFLGESVVSDAVVLKRSPDGEALRPGATRTFEHLLERKKGALPVVKARSVWCPLDF